MSLCVCRHGEPWHEAARTAGDSSECAFEGCECWRFRPLIETDGASDGMYQQGGGIKDHAYLAPMYEPWGRCTVCGLAESAHVSTATPYRLGSRRLDDPINQQERSRA